MNRYPYTRFYFRDVRARYGRYWDNHFSTVGLVGLNEACLNLLVQDIGTGEGRDFALQVLDHMRGRLAGLQEETGRLYNLEATPAESAGYRLALLDRKRFPDIICANQQQVASGAQPFYTNSSHLPVNYTGDVFEALDLQDELQARYTGGTVMHVFLGEALPDPQAAKRFIRKVCEEYRLPYLTLSPTFSVCPSHGHLLGEQSVCPKSGPRGDAFQRRHSSVTWAKLLLLQAPR